MRDENELPMHDATDDGADDLVIRRAAGELRSPVRFSADFDARVMAAVRAAAADDAVERRVAAEDGVLPIGGASPRRERGVRRAWAWIASPRTLRVSPLAGLAAAAALAFVLLEVARRPAAQAPEQQVASARDTGASPEVSRVVPVANAGTQVQQVQFVLVAPSAKSVSLVGDFNDWNATATPLTPVRAGGVWTITVPLAPGRYTYNFVVDGSRVMPDPAAPPAPADDFGTPASVVTVAGAQS